MDVPIDSVLVRDDLFNDRSFKTNISNDGSSADNSNLNDDIEVWLMDSLYGIIPEDMRVMYINEDNVLFAHSTLTRDGPTTSQKIEWIHDLTRNGKRSILSSLETSLHYTNLTYRNDSMRRKIAFDYKTDPAFIRVIDYRSEKYLLSNLVRCACDQLSGLNKYVEHVRTVIDNIPLLEELNRFALSHKIAYKSARQRLWFVMGILEDLKVVEKLGLDRYIKTLKMDGTVDYNSLDRSLTLKWLNYCMNPVGLPPRLCLNSNSNSFSNAGTFPTVNNSSEDILLDSSSMPIDTNAVPVSGFTSLGIGECSTTPQRKNPIMADVSKLQVNSFENLMDLMGNESTTPFFAFEDISDNSKSNLPFPELSFGTSWQALQMMKKYHNKQKDTQATKQNFSTLIRKNRDNTFKNALSTLAILEAACKLYGKGPKWCNPNRREFDSLNKNGKLVYVKPKQGNANDLAYQYLMQYSSIHQKLNGGTRQEFATSYGIILLHKPNPNEPAKSYTVNQQPWLDPTFAKKWTKLSIALGQHSPWMIAPLKHTDPKHDTISDNTKHSQSELKKEPPAGQSETIPPEPSPDHSEVPERTSEKGVFPPTGTLYNATLPEGSDPNSPATTDLKPRSVSDLKSQLLDGSPQQESKKEEQLVLEEERATDLPQKPLESLPKEEENAESPPSSEEHVEQPKPLRTAPAYTGPVFITNGLKQVKLTHLFRYVYKKIQKAKPLPECPELLDKRPKKVQLEDVDIRLTSVKRKRVLDDDFIPEELPPNYVKINKDAEKEEGARSVDPLPTDNPVAEPVDRARNRLIRKEKIRRMREILKDMIEYEAVESDDENLSDPEDIKKSLELLKRRLQNSSDSESEYDDSDTEFASDMENFIGEVDKVNEEDEEVARYRFYQDMKNQEDKIIAKLMTFKEHGEREMTRREERMKLLLELKKSKGKLLNDLHLSDFESSEGEESDSKECLKKLNKQELKQLLGFKESKPAQTHELEQFINFKLQTNIQKDDSANMVSQLSNSLKCRRDAMDSMFGEGFESIFSSLDNDRSVSMNPFNSMQSADVFASRSPTKNPAFVMKSFRWDKSQTKPLNSSNIRNVNGFVGFHSISNQLTEKKRFP